MPTYQYKCKSCGYEFEIFASIKSYHKEVECPVCNQKAQLIISGGNGLIFRGSGFYITDYGKKSSSH